MKLVRFEYKGDDWNIYLIPEGEMDEFVDDGTTDATDAFIEIEKREIYISEEELGLHTLYHELFHLSLTSQYTESMNLTAAQVEELCCEVFAHEGEYLIKLAKEILKVFSNKSSKDETILTFKWKKND